MIYNGTFNDHKKVCKKVYKKVCSSYTISIVLFHLINTSLTEVGIFTPVLALELSQVSM